MTTLGAQPTVPPTPTICSPLSVVITDRSNSSNTSLDTLSSLNHSTSFQSDHKTNPNGSTGWKLVESYGETILNKKSTDADVLSAMEFDSSGEYLAVGTKGGKITIYTSNNKNTKPNQIETRKKSLNSNMYSVYTEFQSHTAEFDYLKSLEIEEKINKIKWCKSSVSNNNLFLLSTNDKTIKLWKIYNQDIHELITNNYTCDPYHSQSTSPSSISPASTNSIHSDHSIHNYNTNNNNINKKNKLNDSIHVPHSITNLNYNKFIRFPKVLTKEKIIKTTSKRIYSNAHSYHINSISLNYDGETYLSADDLRINMWNLNIPNQSYNIIDIKPTNMEELTEVITAADFHPNHCNILMYSSSRGSIKLGDTRESALLDKHSKIFEEKEDPESRSFFSEIIASISDVKFTPNGRYIIARDYLTVKVWDINVESKPLHTINIHEQLRPKLCDLYDNDCIFDKFECGINGNGNKIATGSYSNESYVYDINGKNSSQLIPSNYSGGRRHSLPSTTTAIGTNNNNNNKLNETNTSYNQRINNNNLDITRKALQSVWNPIKNEVTVAVSNNLYVYALQI